MSKREEPQAIQSPPVLSADSSGEFDETPEHIVPLLKRSVEHMKESNKFVKMTNKELIKLNRGVARQNRLLWVVTFTALVVLIGLIFSLQKLHVLGLRLDSQLVQQEMINTKLAVVVEKTEETKDAIDEQPKITVKPADSTDPTSKPTLVVETPKKTKKPPKSGGKKPDLIEFPFDPPKDKK